MRLILLAVAVCVVLLPSSADAQDGTIDRSYLSTVRAGHEAQFEEAMKQHMGWHRQQGDTWRWDAYMLVSGERLGQYIAITPGHEWSDFDAPVVTDAEDAADAMSRFGPHVESISSGFANALIDLSRPPADPDPSPLVQVYTYQLKPGQAPQFLHVLGRFTEAAEQTDWPGRYVWLSGVTGGRDGTFILVVPHENWASMAPRYKSPPEVMEDAFGRQAADALGVMFNEAVESVLNEVWQYRPDLSYIP